MYTDQDPLMIYITLYNENYKQPSTARNRLKMVSLRGCISIEVDKAREFPRVQLLGSGPILNEVLKAADILRKRLESRCRCLERNEL